MRLCVWVYVCVYLYIYASCRSVCCSLSMCVCVRACVCIVHTWVHIALDDGISKRMRVIDTNQQQQQQQCLSTNSTHTQVPHAYTHIRIHIHTIVHPLPHTYKQSAGCVDSSSPPRLSSPGWPGTVCYAQSTCTNIRTHMHAHTYTYVSLQCS